MKPTERKGAQERAISLFRILDPAMPEGSRMHDEPFVAEDES